MRPLPASSQTRGQLPAMVTNMLTEDYLISPNGKGFKHIAACYNDARIRGPRQDGRGSAQPQLEYFLPGLPLWSPVEPLRERWRESFGPIFSSMVTVMNKSPFHRAMRTMLDKAR